MNALIVCAVLAASAFDQVFDQGTAAYDRGDFPAAIESFEQLVGQGVVRKEVFYNLGNAYYRNGQLAPAITNYERAWRLDPGAPLVGENLARAVGQTERGMQRPQPPGWEQGLFFWHEGLSAYESLSIAAAAWMLAWLLLCLRLARPWPYLRAGATIAFVFAAAFLASWWIKSHPAELAVAAEARVPVRYGNRPTETVRFELYEGDRVEVEQIKDGWVRVRTADGERGWTEAEHLNLVGPPYATFNTKRTAQLVSPADDSASGGGVSATAEATPTAEARP